MDQLADIRARHQQQWKQARKEEEAAPPPPEKKPKEPVVVGNKVIADGKKQWTMSEYTALLDTFYRVRPQKETKLKKLDIDMNTANFFQSFLRRANFEIQRCGVLFGRADEKAGVVKGDALYEPLQGMNRITGDPEMLEDGNFEKVRNFANMLDLKPVGWVASRKGQRDYVLSGYEVCKTAELIATYSPMCGVVLVRVDDEGEVNFEAYQVSDQCVKMWKEGLLQPHPEKPGFVKSTREVECVKEHESEDASKKRGGMMYKSNEVDTALFTIPVAISSFESTVVTSTFVRMNRPDHIATGQDLHNYLREPKRAQQTLAQKISDFHVLAFLASQDSPMDLVIYAIQHNENDTLQQVLAPYLL